MNKLRFSFSISNDCTFGEVGIDFSFLYKNKIYVKTTELGYKIGGFNCGYAINMHNEKKLFMDYCKVQSLIKNFKK